MPLYNENLMEEPEVIYTMDGKFFSNKVTREFGENIMLPNGDVTVVYPLNDYVRRNGYPYPVLVSTDA